MLDAAAQHPGRTGRETLRLAAQLLGLPRSRADEMLERVGLDGAGKRRVGDYSLGMRQRLGIAQRAARRPGGADARRAGQRAWTPRASAGCASCCATSPPRGGTVLLSSHLLGEVQATVDRLVVIGDGRIVAQGTMSRARRAERPRRRRRPRSGPGRPARRPARRGPAGRPAGRRHACSSAPATSRRSAVPRSPPDRSCSSSAGRRRPGGPLLPADLARRTRTDGGGRHDRRDHRPARRPSGRRTGRRPPARRSRRSPASSSARPSTPAPAGRCSGSPCCSRSRSRVPGCSGRRPAALAYDRLAARRDLPRRAAAAGRRRAGDGERVDPAHGADDVHR